MTDAVLSFTSPGSVALRCRDLGIDEHRELEADPPFERWSRIYAAGYASRDVLACLGLAIGRWLEGPQQWLARLADAAAPLILTVDVGPHPGPLAHRVLAAPWELIARVEPTIERRANAAASSPTRDIDSGTPSEIEHLLAPLGPDDMRGASHLALDPGLLFTCVRRLGQARAQSPSPYRVSVVFMAAQPEGLVGLAVDREEAAIRRAAGSIGMDVAVEESGSLRRLGELVAQVDKCDVLHLSCHGDCPGEPVLALENDLGQRADATADDLCLGIGERPPLVFLSSCSSAGPGSTLWSLSADLCRRGWPSVLGWSCAVTDAGAIELAAALYRQLALRQPLTHAFAQARAQLAATADGGEWHKARLFLGSHGGGPIVDGTSSRPGGLDRLRGEPFLDPRTRKIPVAPSDQPFPHRRAVQRVLAALHAGDHSGVVVHGADPIARATLATRVLRRLERDLARVVVARQFAAAAVLRAIYAQTANPGVDAIVTRFRDRLADDPRMLLPVLRQVLEQPCQAAREGAFVLVLHGFDPLPAAGAQPGARHGLAADRLIVARAVIGAFTGARTASRLVFTSAAAFSVIAEDGGDMVDTLFIEPLLS